MAKVIEDLTPTPPLLQPQPDEPGWLTHLRQDGYCVIPAVVSSEEVSTATQLLWDTWLAGPKSKIDRRDKSTWTNANWPGAKTLGFLQSHGGSHSEAAWYLRGIPAVKDAFEKVWGTDRLLTRSVMPSG